MERASEKSLGSLKSFNLYNFWSCTWPRERAEGDLAPARDKNLSWSLLIVGLSRSIGIGTLRVDQPSADINRVDQVDI